MYLNLRWEVNRGKSGIRLTSNNIIRLYVGWGRNKNKLFGGKHKQLILFCKPTVTPRGVYPIYVSINLAFADGVMLTAVVSAGISTVCPWWTFSVYPLLSSIVTRPSMQI